LVQLVGFRHIFAAIELPRRSGLKLARERLLLGVLGDQNIPNLDENIPFLEGGPKEIADPGQLLNFLDPLG